MMTTFSPVVPPWPLAQGGAADAERKRGFKGQSPPLTVVGEKHTSGEGLGVCAGDIVSSCTQRGVGDDGGGDCSMFWGMAGQDGR